MEDIIILEKFRDFLPPLPPEDFNDLRNDIRANGCRDPLVIWVPFNILVDGHSRNDICKELGITPKKVYMEFESKEDALFYAFQNQTNRRNLKPWDRCELVLKFEPQFKKIGKEKMSEGGKKHGKQEACTNFDNHDSQPHDTLGVMAKKANMSRGNMAKAKKITEKGTDEEKDKLRKDEATIGSVHENIKKREKAQKKPVEARPAPDGMVDREALKDILGMLKFSLGKETLNDTGYFVFHNGWVIVGDDNVAVMARSGVKYSFAVEPDLLDTFESCENEFLEIEVQDGYLKVIIDRGDDDYSTSKTKPIESFSKLTKYLIDIDEIDEALKEPNLPDDFISGVTQCFSYKRKSRGEAKEVSLYDEEKLVMVTGDAVISTDMWRASTYKMDGESNAKIYLPYWLAATLEDLHREQKVKGYTVKNGSMYFKMSTDLIVATEIPKIEEKHFPERKIVECFSHFRKGESIKLIPILRELKNILKDCKSKQKKILNGRRTDARIKITLDTERLIIDDVTTDQVHRSVPFRTKDRYEFTVATVHLEEALKYVDTLYVGEGAIMFEKENYQHAIPACTNGKQELGYLIKH